jgi:hypothetical protein
MERYELSIGQRGDYKWTIETTGGTQPVCGICFQQRKVHLSYNQKEIRIRLRPCMWCQVAVHGSCAKPLDERDVRWSLNILCLDCYYGAD